MKITRTLTSLLAAGLCFAGVNAAHAQVKVGVVDMNKVFGGYYKTKDAENKINDARETAKKELDDRMESHKQMLDEINSLNKEVDNPALSAAAKSGPLQEARREDPADAPVGAGDQRVQGLAREAAPGAGGAHAQPDRRGDHDDHQRKVKNDNYDLVLDKSGQSLNGVQIVLHSKESMEFSDDVITALNKTRPAVSTAAPARPDSQEVNGSAPES